MVEVKIDACGAVYDLQKDDDCEDPLRRKHVLKWSYPYSTRVSELEMIREARRVLGRYDNIPDPTGKVLAVKISNSLPNVIGENVIDDIERNLQAFLGVGYEKKRILRFTLYEYLEPIHSLDSLVHFKESIRHIVLGMLLLIFIIHHYNNMYNFENNGVKLVNLSIA